MCGLAGFIAPGGGTDLEQTARRMNDAIIHRGPDSAGQWCDREVGLGLGHRRLSILDLSPAGHQPMVSAAGRFVIAFNGEVYNHLELRRELELAQAAPQWKGHSDTETLLACFEAWGCVEAVPRFAGMFAIAVYDRSQRTLWLIRDRFGEKPLYYGWQGRSFLFGSELKALRAHPEFQGVMDPHAAGQMLRYSYVPAPLSIYRDIRKLPPAHLMAVPCSDMPARHWPEPRAYWSPAAHVVSGLDQPVPDAAEAVDALEARLRATVAEQMVSDVPLGGLLSGGVDSSTIVALMQAQSSRPVHSFCIGFDEKKFNEAEFAKAVARHLGTHHTELYVRPQQALDLIPRLPGLFDEPVGDYSTIPTFLVARLARQHVTVALSGDGGDELFCGYTRYFLATRLWRALGWLPGPLRRLAANLLLALRPLAAAATPLLPRAQDRVQRVADVLRMPDFDALYDNLNSHWRPPHSVVLGQDQAPALLRVEPELRARLSSWQAMMLTDQRYFLPDHVLAKVDRAAMSVSLETRAPLLDHRVAEFALRLPMSLKVRDGQSKWLLRQVLYRYVPRELIERPKMGFTVPVSQWLRGPLGEWAEDLLGEQSLRRQNLFDVGAIRQRWTEHRQGRRDHGQSLWNMLVLQQWLRAS